MSVIASRSTNVGPYWWGGGGAVVVRRGSGGGAVGVDTIVGVRWGN